MQFSYGPGPSRYFSLTADAIASVTYPLDNVAGTVFVEFVTEPLCPGHEEFACSFGYTSGDYIAGIQVRDSTGLPSNEGWHPFDGTGEWTGEKFYQETVVHEVGHVVAGQLMGEDERDEMTRLFYKRDPMGEQDGRIGVPSDWDGATWEDSIREAVAEVFKDTFFPRSKRAYDNRTSWSLPEDNFRRYLELIGLRFEGVQGAKEARLYTPDLGHSLEIASGGVNWVPYLEPGGFWDHADATEGGDPFDPEIWWAMPGISIQGGLGKTVPYALHELPLGQIGGSMTFTTSEIMELGGRAVEAYADLSMDVDIDLADFAYATTEYMVGIPDGHWFKDPSTWSMGGWADPLFAEYTTIARYGLRWRMIDGLGNHIYQATPVDEYLLLCSKWTDLDGDVSDMGTPDVNGPLTFPTLDALHGAGYLDNGFLNLALILDFAHEEGDPEAPLAYTYYPTTPSAPGVVESWAARLWGIQWAMAPDTMPPFPGSDLPATAVPSRVLSVRRSKARAGV
jgi:hypothetical protein